MKSIWWPLDIRRLACIKLNRIRSVKGRFYLVEGNCENNSNLRETIIWINSSFQTRRLAGASADPLLEPAVWALSLYGTLRLAGLIRAKKRCLDDPVSVSNQGNILRAGRSKQHLLEQFNQFQLNQLVRERERDLRRVGKSSAGKVAS